MAVDISAWWTTAVYESGGVTRPVVFAGEPRLPSGVFLHPETRALTIGRPAFEASVADPEGYRPDPMTLLRIGTPAPNARFDPVAAVSEVLAHVARAAAAQAGAEVTALTVITAQAWGLNAQDRLQQAAARAGLPEPTIITTAAAAAALAGGAAAGGRNDQPPAGRAISGRTPAGGAATGWTSQGDEASAGGAAGGGTAGGGTASGGTRDASEVERAPGRRRAYVVVCTAGDAAPELTVVDAANDYQQLATTEVRDPDSPAIDEALIQLAAERAAPGSDPAAALDDWRVAWQIQQARVALAVEQRASVTLPDREHPVALTRDDLAAAGAPHLTRLSEAAKRVLVDAEVDPADVAAVVLVGDDGVMPGLRAGLAAAGLRPEVTVRDAQSLVGGAIRPRVTVTPRRRRSPVGLIIGCAAVLLGQTVMSAWVLPLSWGSLALALALVALAAWWRAQSARQASRNPRAPGEPIMMATAGTVLQQAPPLDMIGGALLGVATGLTLTRRPALRLSLALLLGAGFALVASAYTVVCFIAALGWWTARRG